MARVFKWLTLVLFAYVITAFLAHPHWPSVVRATFIPHIEWTKDYLAVLVGILGTTISPYLFFWQAAQEVEEDRERGKATVAQRRGSTNVELRIAQKDVITGMLLSNLVMYFLILTTGATLHVHGVTQIETAKQAAEVEPIKTEALLIGEDAARHTHVRPMPSFSTCSWFLPKPPTLPRKLKRLAKDFRP